MAVVCLPCAVLIAPPLCLVTHPLTTLCLGLLQLGEKGVMELYRYR